MPYLSLEALLAEVRRYVNTNYPGRVPIRLRIDLHDDERIQLPVPPEAAETMVASPELREAILRVLAAGPLKPAAIAARAKYAHSGHFKDTLRAMVTGGEVVRQADGACALPGDD